MKKLNITIPIKLLSLLILQPAVSQTMNIRINQIGYYPKANKIAIIVWPGKAMTFNVKKVSDSTIVFSGKLSPSLYAASSEDSVKRADFTDLNVSGKYFISIPGNGNSLSFEISDNILRNVAFGSLKSFYYQRCSYELKSECAGIWSRASGHPDTACVYHNSLHKMGSKPSPKGWYDAGDYGKYVVNAGITVATLLQIYENFPVYFADGSIKIPESGNGKNDLLDELKFELDWLKTMQDTDGGVFHKITTLTFPGFIMPANDTATRYFIGKTTSAALDFAAMMAMAGRIYKKYNSSYAADCAEKAKKAWIWAKANPAVYFTNPPGVHTGRYTNTDVSDEFTWAAAELLITTRDIEYKRYLEDHITMLTYRLPSWGDVSGLGSLSLATIPNNLSDTLLASIKKSIIDKANLMIDEINADPYRIANSGFGWGCTGTYGNSGICLVYAYILTKDLKYMRAAAEIADYLLGKNATAFSFFTYYGHKTPMNIHHRPSGSDSIVQPVPGFIVGGPNPGRTDPAKFPYTQPAKSYVDAEQSFSSNEVCINWSAPATFLLAAVDFAMGNMKDKIDFTPPSKVDNPPVVNILPEFNSSFAEHENILIKATVNNPLGIRSVELYIDNKFAGSLKAAPYEWSVNDLVPGPHTISVNAINQKELVTEKANYIIITQNNSSATNSDKKTNP